MATVLSYNNNLIKFNNYVIDPGSAPVPVIPANTVRVRTSDGNAPVKTNNTTYETATLVEGTSDVYDVYKSGTSFSFLLYQSTNVTEVIAANITEIVRTDNMFYGCTALTTVNNILTSSTLVNLELMFSYCSSLTTIPLFNTSSVTRMTNMFAYCSSLTTIPLLDTSSATKMTGMFQGCSSLTTVPLLNTSSATSMLHMFNGCINVESGALALYQQASTQANPPSNHTNTFYNCGSNTVTGAAELAQIPSDWK